MTVSRHHKIRKLILGALAASAVCLSAGAGTGVGAQEVVQALPDPANEDLSAALQRLSGSPNSVSALVDAGRASLELGDNASALGFFNRAQRIAPEDGRVLAGLGIVALRRGDAVTALQLFRNADAAGEQMGPLAAERALAFDLVGQNARAQRLYRAALGREKSDEIIRQLALSHAITGDAQLSEELLLPLMQQQDRGAFRTRAFALAILGKGDEAVTIAEAMLPPRVANRMAEYLRFMPRLTPSQQSAAANLGRFPASAQIGQDDPRLAALGIESEGGGSVPRRPAPTPVVIARVDERLIPEGEPLGPIASESAELAPTELAPTELAVVEQPLEEASSGELPAVFEPVALAANEPSAVQGAVEAVEAVAASGSEILTVSTSDAAQEPITQTSSPEAVVVARLEDPEYAALVEAAQAEDARTTVITQEVVVQAVANLEPEPEPVSQPVDLGSIFAEFAEAENVPAVSVASGAVDITSIEPRREQPKPEPVVEVKPEPPKHPARHWVQLGIGQRTNLFSNDLRRLRREADGLLDGRDAFYAPLNRTNRLLVGPFDSARGANKFVSDLKEVGVDSYRFSSRQDEEVTPL